MISIKAKINLFLFFIIFIDEINMTYFYPDHYGMTKNEYYYLAKKHI